MGKIFFIVLFFFFIYTPAFAVDIAPPVSEREIILEKLSRLEEGQRNLNKRIDDMGKSLDKRIGDLRSDMNSRFSDLRSDMYSQYKMLRWIMGLFVTISMIILGFVLRLQWLMQQRLTTVETTLETQKEEFVFLRNFIEKLLPPKGVL